MKEVCREHEIAETLYYSLPRRATRGRPGRSRRQGRALPRARAPQACRPARASAGARPTSSRSRRKHCGAGSEGGRRRVSRARAPDRELAVVARAMQVSPRRSTGRQAAHGPGPASGLRPSRRGDRRDRETQPDQRQPNGHGARQGDALARSQPCARGVRAPARARTMISATVHRGVRRANRSRCNSEM